MHIARLSVRTRVSIVKKLLRSDAIWRLSGLTYATAVLATRGRLLSVADYLKACRSEMAALLRLVPSARSVLEFGAGLGGNLTSVSSSMERALGVDINRRYVSIAQRIADQSRARNVRFSLFDGVSVPSYESGYDFVFSMGVFERIARPRVDRYVGLLAKVLAPRATMALYFLSERAGLTPFVNRLGASAYEYWTETDIRTVAEAHGLVLRSIVPWGASEGASGLVTHVANMAIFTTGNS